LKIWAIAYELELFDVSVVFEERVENAISEQFGQAISQFFVIP